MSLALFVFATDVTLGFQQPAYTVREGDGSVTVCLELEPASAETISAFVAANDLTAQDSMLPLFVGYLYLRHDHTDSCVCMHI